MCVQGHVTCTIFSIEDDVFFRTHHHVTFLDNAVAILNRGNALSIRY